MARRAKSLATLLAQVNKAAPGRSKKSDGWIGDAAHRKRKSDHNPNTRGVVCAIDITHDPKKGMDAGKLARTLWKSGDKRLHYCISNGQILYPGSPAKKYTGVNAHKQHCHVSVFQRPDLYDNPAPWNLGEPHPATIPFPGPVAEAATPARPLLKQGSKGEEVRDLQARLNGNGASLSLDGDFGAKTLAAVKAFQAARGLKADGKVGPQTWAALLAPATPTPPPLAPKQGEAQWAVSFLESLGWSKMDAAVWVANIVWESGGNRPDPSKHTIIWNARGDKGSDGKYHSFGAPQWNDKHGRYQALLELAKQRGTAWDDRETQMRHLHHELLTTEKITAQRVRNATTLEEKMKAALGFWRPSIPHADKRLAIARNLMGTILPPERRTPEALTSLGAYALMETDMADEKTVTVGGEKATVEHVPGWKNWRTLAVNAAMAAAIPLLTFLSTYDWTQVVNPTVAVYIVIAVNVIMRFLTTGPALSDVSVKKG